MKLLLVLLLVSARARGSYRASGSELGVCNVTCNVTATSYLRDRLPVLAAPGASPAWDRYLEHVYGEPLPRSAYPVDLSQFSWFYFDHLPLTVAPARMAATCESAYGHAWTGSPGCGSGGRGLPESQPALRAAGFFVQQHDPTGPRPPQTLANGSWVEVMRTAMNQRSTETPGSWYWLARGSGVWLNVRSIYTDIPSRGEAYWFFGRQEVRGLVRRGFNTLLFPRLAGTRTYTGVPVNNDRVELIALHSTPGLRGTCADGFMTGWNHGSVCSCKESLGVVNCRGGKSEIAHDAPPPPAKTGRHHSIVRNLTFASLEPPLVPDEPLAAYLERLYHEAPREPLELTSLQWFWWGAPLRVDCSWPHAGPKALVCTSNATAGAVDVSPNLGLSLLGKYGFTVPSFARHCRDSPQLQHVRASARGRTTKPGPRVGVTDSTSSTVVVSGPIEVMRISTALYRRGQSRLPRNYTRRLGREGGSNGCWVRCCVVLT